MGNIYIIFIIIALITGLVFWVIGKYRIPAVIALIASMFAPLLSLFIVAQRETEIGAYEFLKEEMLDGNLLARIDAALHIYLIIWLSFLLVRGIIHLIISPTMKERYKKWFSGISTLVKSRS